MTVEGITALFGAGVGIFAAIGGYFKSKYDTENNKNRISNIEKRWEDNTKGDSDLKDRVLTLEGEVRYMKSDLTEIKKELKEMMTNQEGLAKLMVEVSTNVKTLTAGIDKLSLAFDSYKKETQTDIENFYSLNSDLKRPIK